MANNISTEGTSEALKLAMQKIRKHVKITKTVVTRSVKGTRGDSYVGFSAGWDTIQDDAGGSADLMQDDQSLQGEGLTIREARLASMMLGMQVDIAAHANAMAGGNLSPKQYEDAVRAIKHNYAKLMTDLFGNENGGK